MSNWAYVENGQIKECLDFLPESWKNISNFYASSNNLDFLASYGWFPIEKESYAYDPKKYKLDNRRFEITDRGNVIEKWDLIELPKKDYKEVYHSFIHEVRIKRNTLLKESDWTQLNDVIKSMPDDLMISWEAYRKNLREITNDYPFRENVEYDINQVVWPLKPEK